MNKCLFFFVQLVLFQMGLIIGLQEVEQLFYGITAYVRHGTLVAI